jgi:hypothetical protein
VSGRYILNIDERRKEMIQKFRMGTVVATPGAMAAFNREGDMDLLDSSAQAILLLLRHSTGDWGIVPEEDAALNELALAEGGRIMSAYILRYTQEKIWVITEADRETTTFLLPDEY